MITITVDDTAFRSYLSQLQARLDDLSPVMSGIGQELETRIAGRFETESDPSGVPWKEWAESTRETYPYPGTPYADAMGGPGAGRILERYSDMRHGLSWSADATSVRVGFNQIYATSHEFGTRYMPRRGLLLEDPVAGTLSESDERAVLDILETLLNPG